MFSKTFVALSLALASLVAADGLVCDFIMTPTPDGGVWALKSSINYAVGHTLGEKFPNTAIHDVNTLVRHDDGTFDVRSTITVEGADNADVAAFVEKWDKAQLQGFLGVWDVKAANCVL